MINYFSSLFTYNKLKNSLNFASTNTVKEFLNYLEETYLLQYLSNYSFKIKDEFRKPKKVYSIDTGMTKSLDTSLSPNIGTIYENIVFLNEKRNGSEISFFSNDNFEIDFVIKENNKVVKLIQVSKDIYENNTYKREIKSLINGSKLFHCNNLYLISESIEDSIVIDDSTINIIPLWKYLLSM